MESPGQHSSSSSAAPDPHCHAHARFVEACATCRRARANFLPYPVKKAAPLARSFGLTDDITENTFKQPTRPQRFGDPETDTEFSFSLLAIRFLLRLIWPFGRIL